MDTVSEGQVLAGKYRVERVIGKGGMGMVVAATHQQLEQRVALKFLLPAGLEDSDLRARFLREARAAVRLKSEHVARVLDVGTLANDTPYIVMEFLEGLDLHDLLSAEQRLPVTQAVEYVLQACEAIAEAHAAGIVHRDLKPANLFLTRRNDGSPCLKVLDFGISKITSSESMAHHMTQGATMLGTPHYMSPEQLRSSRDVDARADIWSLGMILHELLTGEVAFVRDSLPDLCAAILLEPLPPPRSLRADLPEALAQVIVRTLSKSPDDRPQTLAELARDLAPFTPGGDTAAARVAAILGMAAPRSPRPITPMSAMASLPPGGAATVECVPRALADEPGLAPPAPPGRRDPGSHSPPERSEEGAGGGKPGRQADPPRAPLPVVSSRGPRLAALAVAALVLSSIVALWSRPARVAPTAGLAVSASSAQVIPDTTTTVTGAAVAPSAQVEATVVAEPGEPRPVASVPPAAHRPARPASAGHGGVRKVGQSSDFGDRK